MIEAKVIADSISPEGVRLTTMQVKFHRFILPEWNTHRMFSRNAASSRAIPVTKMIENVRNNPAIPIHIGKNMPGMQAKEELIGAERDAALKVWLNARDCALESAEKLNALGVHKQVVNRLLEPFMWTSVVVTGIAEAYANFFNLRYHPDAQPEIQELARVVYEAIEASKPTELAHDEWHLPYVEHWELGAFGPVQVYLREKHVVWSDDMFWELARKISAARCCRVSYNKHDGSKSTVEEDLKLCERLIGSVPLHASPFEHQATPDILRNDGFMVWWENESEHGNLPGWRQYRKMLPNEYVTEFSR